MKAAVYKGNGKLSVEEWNGRMPEEKEVQIKVSYCGICGSDIHILQGSEDHRMHLPSVIGHECSGTVWRVGSKVESVKPGDRVAVWPVKSCKECFACKEGYGHVCQYLKVRGCRTDFADIQNKKECRGNRQWQNHYLRNWVANTKGKAII